MLRRRSAFSGCCSTTSSSACGGSSKNPQPVSYANVRSSKYTRTRSRDTSSGADIEVGGGRAEAYSAETADFFCSVCIRGRARAAVVRSCASTRDEPASDTDCAQAQKLLVRAYEDALSSAAQTSHFCCQLSYHEPTGREFRAAVCFSSVDFDAPINHVHEQQAGQEADGA